MSSVEVNDRIDAIVTGTEAQPTYPALRFEGASTGGQWLFEVHVEEGASVLAPLTIRAGTDAAGVTAQVLALLTSSGVAMSATDDGALYATGPANLTKLRIAKYDAGIDVLGATAPALPDPDLDGDGHVDGADLAILLGAWGPCRECPADLNGDAQVDGADLAMLLGGWTG